MRPRLLAIATLAAAIVLFAWQSISHGLLGLPEKGMHQFPNDSTAATAHALRALAPQNGVYFSAYGVLAAVDISADYKDKTKQFVSMMAKQLVLNLAVVFVLALMFGRLGGSSVLLTGATYSALALAFMGLAFISNWIWWNFPAAWTLGNVVDQVIGFFLVGITLAALEQRFGEPRIATAERAGVRAQGGLPTSDAGVRTSR
jgi:hypothetical protein